MIVKPFWNIAKQKRSRQRSNRISKLVPAVLISDRKDKVEEERQCILDRCAGKLCHPKHGFKKHLLGGISMNKSISLRREDLCYEYEDEMEPELLPMVPDFERSLEKGGWKPSKREMKDVHIQKCNLLIKQNLEDLAYKHGTTQADIGRVAMWIGKDLLWSMKEIEEIGAIKSKIHNSGDWHDRNYLSSIKFDGLKTSYATALHMEFHEVIVKQCDKLTSILDLKPGVIRQLALMAGLIHAQEIPDRDRLEMVKILREFVRWLKMKLEKAEEVVLIIEGRGLEVTEDKPTSWQDVVY
jgi:hypothetical protein